MTVPRIVLDSNVIVSGLLFGGPPRRLLAHVIDGSVECCISLPILDEIRDVLQRPKFGLTVEQALDFVEEVHGICHLVTPGTALALVKNDPDDNRIIECAIAAGATVIVTGDSDLLDLGRVNRIRIVTPRQFLRELGVEEG